MVPVKQKAFQAMRNRITFLLACSLVIGLLTGLASSQEPNRAGLVVRLGEEDVVSQCVAFDETEISGLKLLEKSGLTLAISQKGLGALVCGIEGTGCPADDCFCACKGGGDCEYWSYWQLSDHGWTYSQIGASTYQVSPGEVDGWSWGPGSLTDAVAPPIVTFEEVCSEQPTIMAAIQSEDMPTNSTNWGSIVAFAVIMLVFVTLLWLIGRRSRVS